MRVRRIVAIVLTALLFAATPAPKPIPTASPALLPTPKSPAPRPTPKLRTIIVEKATPLCSALGRHFDGIVQPMLVNNTTLDAVDVQFGSLIKAFKSPDFAQQYYQLRTKLIDEVGKLYKSLPEMQDQINRLRKSERLAAKPADAKRFHDLAEQFQEAYDKQKQLTIDLQGVTQGMMQYDALAHPHPINGFTFSDEAEPSDMKDIRSYLRFDGQRDVMRRAQNKALDIALDIVATVCT